MIARRVVLAGALALAASEAMAQETGLVEVTLITAKGAITLELNTGKAPITAGNFLRYVTAKRYDHSSFYRVSRAPNDANYGLVEGGVKGDPAKLFKPIAHESTLVTGLSHKDGTISMGRGKPGSANAEFFICVGDHPGFDATAEGDGDHAGFAAFGRVIDGMDVVHAIFALPTSPTAGAGALRGQMLSPPVPILTARKTGGANLLSAPMSSDKPENPAAAALRAALAAKQKAAQTRGRSGKGYASERDAAAKSASKSKPQMRR